MAPQTGTSSAKITGAETGGQLPAQPLVWDPWGIPVGPPLSGLSLTGHHTYLLFIRLAIVGSVSSEDLRELSRVSVSLVVMPDV